MKMEQVNAQQPANAPESGFLGKLVAFEAPGGTITGRVSEQYLRHGEIMVTVKMAAGGEAYVRAKDVRLLEPRIAGYTPVAGLARF
jgi:hypothetical protein